jgi:hypothetical protein
VKNSPTTLFEVGAINRLPPTPRVIDHSENRKALLRSKA